MRTNGAATYSIPKDFIAGWVIFMARDSNR